MYTNLVLVLSMGDIGAHTELFYDDPNGRGFTWRKWFYQRVLINHQEEYLHQFGRKIDRYMYGTGTGD